LIDQDLHPTSAINDAARQEASHCAQASPLGIVTAANEPAKLDASSSMQGTPQVPNPQGADQPGVVQAIYRSIVPADASEQSDVTAEETPTAEDVADPNAAVFAETAMNYSGLFSKVGGILIVCCSLVCGLLVLKRLLSTSDNLGIGA
jgi:hypothetical protein